MAAYKLGKVLPFTLISVMSALLFGHSGLSGPALAGEAGLAAAPFANEAIVVQGERPNFSDTEFSDSYALFQGRLFYFGQNGALYSQQFPVAESGAVSEIEFVDGSTPRGQATPSSFRVIDGRLVFKAERLDDLGRAMVRVYVLDLDEGTPGVVRQSRDAVYTDSVEHEGYLYSVIKIPLPPGYALNRCNIDVEADLVVRRPATSLFSTGVSELVYFSSTTTCRVVMSMKSSPLGLLISTRHVRQNPRSGGYEGRLHRVTDIVPVPPGGQLLQPQGVLPHLLEPSPTVEQVFSLGLSPYATTGNHFVFGNSIFFERQVANYNPFAVGNPNEPQPVYRTFRHDTVSGETQELDFRVGTQASRAVIDGSLFYVKNNSQYQKTLYRLRSETGQPEVVQLSPNGPANEANEPSIIGVHGDRLLLLADTGNGQDLHFLSGDGETFLPLYIDSEVIETAQQFESEGDEVTFLWRDPRQDWSFYRVDFSRPGDATTGTGTSGSIGTEGVKVTVNFDGKSAASRPGVKFEKGEQVEVSCEVFNDTVNVLTDVNVRLKWQRQRGKSLMKDVDVGELCSGLTVAAGERATCNHTWKVRRGSRQHRCVVKATSSERGLREKISISGYVKARR